MSTKIQYEDSSMNNSFNKRTSFKLIIAIIVLSLFVGAIGGIGGILLLSSQGGAISQKLGFGALKNLTIPTVKTEKVIIEESSAIIDSANKVSSAVVSIQLKKSVQDIFGRTYESSGGGTGFIITSDK